MRILLVLVLLAMVAACVMPPPPDDAAPPATAAGAPPPPMAMAAPAPAPFWPFYLPAVQLFPPAPLRLTLSNFSYDAAHVQVLITPYSDCLVRENTPTGDFVLPLNGTRIIEGAPGLDVCWRRAVAIAPDQPMRSEAPAWSPWNRAFLTSGRSIDARL